MESDTKVPPRLCVWSETSCAFTSIFFSLRSGMVLTVIQPFVDYCCSVVNHNSSTCIEQRGCCVFWVMSTDYSAIVATNASGKNQWTLYNSQCIGQQGEVVFYLV